MRYLLYYPMIHVQNEDYIRECSREYGIALGDEVIKEIARKVHNMWEEFRNDLKKIPRFDRLYLESTYENKVSKPITRSIGMDGCLKEILSSGAKIEVTEDKIFEEHKKNVYSMSEETFAKFQLEREQGVYRRINNTLKSDERGLLLFGAFHQPQFQSIFRDVKGMEFEVYDNSDEINNILRYIDDKKCFR